MVNNMVDYKKLNPILDICEQVIKEDGCIDFSQIEEIIVEHLGISYEEMIENNYITDIEIMLCYDGYEQDFENGIFW